MIAPVRTEADLLTTSRQGSEPDEAAATRSTAARTQPGSETTPSESIERATLDAAVAKVSEVFKATDTHLKIEVDDETQRIVVKVLSGDSGKVIRQFPPEEVLELAKYLNGSKGVLLHEQA